MFPPPADGQRKVLFAKIHFGLWLEAFGEIRADLHQYIPTDPMRAAHHTDFQESRLASGWRACRSFSMPGHRAG